MLSIDGRLMAHHKAFTRTDLIAELAPRLYGQDPAELDRALVHILASREIVPLIGVARAREQAYTTAQVPATKATIAQVVERLAAKSGPALLPSEIRAAVAAAEEAGGHRLTAGQRRVVQRLCGSDPAVSVIVGVAGSGKTADLAAGSDTALLAWRSQDVADLNRLARERWDRLGRLPGNDVKALAAAGMPPEIGSSPSRRTPGLASSPAKRSPRSRSTETRWSCAQRRAVRSPSPVRASTRSTWTTATPSPSTAPKVPPTSAPTCSPPAVAESSATSP